MWTSAQALSVSPEQRQILERWIRAPSTPQNIALRARLILMAGAGAANNRIADGLGISRSTVIVWRAGLPARMSIAWERARVRWRPQ